MNHDLHLSGASSAALRARRLLTAVFGLLAMFMVSPVFALTTCKPMGGSPPVPVGSWVTASNPASLKAGEVLSSRQFTSRHEIYHTTATDILIVMSSKGRVDSNSYGALPLTEMPGVGVRVSGISVTPSYALQVRFDRFNGRQTNLTSYLELYRATNGASTGLYQVTARYLVELVMMDPSKYKGGKLTFTGSQYFTTASITTDPNVSSGLTCVEGFMTLYDMLEGQMEVPPLPEPETPTCTFTTATLNQTVEMPPITVTNLAASTDARSAGSNAEGNFSLIASNCKVGAKFNIYFTDANVKSSTQSYLTTGQGLNKQIGMRLYWSNGTTPVRMGPEPTGSQVPTNIAATGTASYSGISMGYPFTVQYVRLPGVAVGDVVPTAVQSRAVVTIVYP